MKECQTKGNQNELSKGYGGYSKKQIIPKVIRYPNLFKIAAYFTRIEKLIYCY